VASAVRTMSKVYVALKHGMHRAEPCMSPVMLPPPDFLLLVTCMLMDRQLVAQASIPLARYLSYAFLNLFTDVAWTTMAGKLFQ